MLDLKHEELNDKNISYHPCKKRNIAFSLHYRENENKQRSRKMSRKRTFSFQCQTPLRF